MNDYIRKRVYSQDKVAICLMTKNHKRHGDNFILDEIVEGVVKRMVEVGQERGEEPESSVFCCYYQSLSQQWRHHVK